MPRRRGGTPTRVKVPREKLIARIEEIEKHELEAYETEYIRYEEDLENWREHAIRALTEAADAVVKEGELPEYEARGWREDSPGYLMVGVPHKPSEPERPVSSAVALRTLRMSEEGEISISEESSLMRFLDDQEWEKTPS